MEEIKIRSDNKISVGANIKTDQAGQGCPGLRPDP